MKLVGWAVVGIALGAAAAFVAELLRPRVSAHPHHSSYLPPRPAVDHRVVLPR